MIKCIAHFKYILVYVQLQNEDFKMSRTRKRNWPQCWDGIGCHNLFLCKIFKERKITGDYWDKVESVEEKSLPDIAFFGKVFSEYKGSYRWAKRHENKKYRHSQKQKLMKELDLYVEDKIVKDIDFYFGL